MSDGDESIREALHRTVIEGDPRGVADDVLRRASRRTIPRTVAKPLLAVAAVAGSLGLFVLLSDAFSPTTPPARVRSSPSAVGPSPHRVHRSPKPTASPSPSRERGPILNQHVSAVPNAPPGLIVFSAMRHQQPAIEALYTADPRTGEVRMIPGADVGDPETPSWAPDGRSIAFIREDQPGIFVMNPDGSGVRQLVDFGTDPTWSPDGGRIAFSGSKGERSDAILEPRSAIYLMNADGTGLQKLAPGAGPTWSPDGTRIAFTTPDGQLAIVNADGGGPLSLGIEGDRPAWSPDGSAIAFCLDHGIYALNPDGTNVRTLVEADGYFLDPSWSPDGQAITFAYDLPDWKKPAGPGGGIPMEFDVYVMNADGSNVHKVTDLATPIFRNSGPAPDWHP